MGTCGRAEGNIWAAESGTWYIARVTPSGQVTEYPTNDNVYDLVSATDHNLLFLEGTKNRIGRLTTTGQLTEFLNPTPCPPAWGSCLSGIAAGPANIWFVEPQADQIAQLMGPGSPATTSLFWRNTQTGDLDVWSLPGGTGIMAMSTLSPAVALDWRVAALADLDGNGVPDLIWRN